MGDLSDRLLQQVVEELKGLRSETNQGFEILTDRVEGLNRRVEGLHESFVVLQGGLADVRRELQQIKEVLSERVIWQNDTISIQTREGSVIYGIIHRESKRPRDKE